MYKNLKFISIIIIVLALFTFFALNLFASGDVGNSFSGGFSSGGSGGGSFSSGFFSSRSSSGFSSEEGSPGEGAVFSCYFLSW